jgi:hypothetical protein
MKGQKLKIKNERFITSRYEKGGRDDTFSYQLTLFGGAHGFLNGKSRFNKLMIAYFCFHKYESI